MVNIRQNICPSNKWNIKCPYAMTPEFIVTHNTANDASAANEIAYMNRNNDYTSYHFAVDDVEIVQGLPLDRNGWHAGDGANGNGNRKGIGIEICYSKSGGARFDQAEKNAAWLTAKLLKERGWGIDRVKKHQDFMNKYCPHRTLDKGWQRYLNMVQDELNKLTQPAPAPKPVNADIAYEALPKPLTVVLNKNANLWNFNFVNFDKAKAVKNYNQGEKIEVVAIAHNKSVNASYYMTGYSWNNGNVRATNGFNVKDCQNYVAPAPPVPEPPKVEAPPVEPPKTAPEAPRQAENEKPSVEPAPMPKAPEMPPKQDNNKKDEEKPMYDEKAINKLSKLNAEHVGLASDVANSEEVKKIVSTINPKVKLAVYIIGDLLIGAGLTLPSLAVAFSFGTLQQVQALSSALAQAGAFILVMFGIYKSGKGK